MKSKENSTIKSPLTKKKVIFTTRERNANFEDGHIKLRICLNNDRKTGTVTLIEEEKKKIKCRLNEMRKKELWNQEQWKKRMKHERQILSRRTRYIRRSLEKNSQSQSIAVHPLNPAEISLFNVEPSIQPVVANENRRRRSRSHSHNITPKQPLNGVSHSTVDETLINEGEEINQEQWPSLYDYFDGESEQLSELMNERFEINVEQLINVDENTLLQYEGDEVEVQVEPSQFLKALKGDDDEIVVLKVVPSNHRLSMHVEEKPMIMTNIASPDTNVSLSSPLALNNVTEMSKGFSNSRSSSTPLITSEGMQDKFNCKRWNWEKDEWQDIVVSDITRASWNISKTSVWDWKNEWQNVKNVCRACDLRADTWNDDDDDDGPFPPLTPKLRKENSFNNNLNDIPVSPIPYVDSANPLNTNVDTPLMNLESEDNLLTSIRSSDLVDLGYMEEGI